jgi:hypothetical protein
MGTRPRQILLTLAAFVGLTVVAVNPTAASAANYSVQDVTVSVNPPSPGATDAVYTVKFVASDGIGLGGPWSIQIVAPNGTDFGCCSAHLDDNTNPVYSQDIGWSGNQTNVLDLDLQNDVARGDSVTLTIDTTSVTGTTNPSSPNTSYTLTVATDTDTTAVRSAPYRLDSGQVSKVGVAVNPTTPKATNAAYTISFVAIDGIGTTGDWSLDVVAPNGTDFGGDGAHLTDNTHPEDSQDIGWSGDQTNVLETLTGSAVPRGDSVSLTIDGVTNPSQNSDYTLTVATDNDPVATRSAPYAIIPECPTGITHKAAGEPWAVAATSTIIAGRACPGYWVVTRTGGVTTIGAAPFLGDMSTHHLAAPMVSIAADPAGSGYWLLGADGGIFSFGNAKFYGSTGDLRLAAPVVSMAATANGQGYWLVASDGGMFGFGDAPFYGSMGGKHLDRPIVGMAVGPAGSGYWLVGSDGGIFAFGDAPFKGSLGGVRLAAPVVGMTSQPGGQGYRMVGSDGGVFDFGNATYYGSLPAEGVQNPGVTTMAATANGEGYYLINASGQIWAFGPGAASLGNA